MNKLPPPAARLRDRVLSATCVLPAPARLVALALAHHCDNEGLCRIGRARLARETGLSPRCVSGALKDLLAADQFVRWWTPPQRCPWYRIVNSPAALATARVRKDPHAVAVQALAAHDDPRLLAREAIAEVRKQRGLRRLGAQE